MGIGAIKDNLKNYLERLNYRIPLDKAYLYGSWAKGRGTLESDVDLLILSAHFEELSPEDRDRLLYRLSAGIPLDLHLFGLTPEEYNSASRLTTVGAIRDSGKAIDLLS
ncbi:nucleotidyltransferase domain-containing protein [Candidatus Amesbacteria bacterium]|nr:nucleotidyltransferase domain-containing protein [Candidatus Amesbacteria bacterium]